MNRPNYQANLAHRPAPPPAGAPDFLGTVRACILENVEVESFGVEELAQALFLSRSHLFRKIKGLTGRSVARYINQVRVGEVKRLLYSTQMNTADIAERTGFADASYLRRVFFRETGQTLVQYRREMEGIPKF